MNFQLKLEGEHGRIEGLAVAYAIENVVKLLQSTTFETGAPVLQGLEVGSAVIELEADQECVDAVVTGVSELARNGVLPKNWKPNACKYLQNVCAISGTSGVTGITLRAGVDSVRLDKALASRCEQAQPKNLRAFGEVQGHLYSCAIDRDCIKSRMHEYSEGATVYLDIPFELREEVLECLKHNTPVSVCGELLYKTAESTLPKQVIVEILHTLKASPNLKGLNFYAGCIPSDVFGGLNSVEAIRGMRDAG